MNFSTTLIATFAVSTSALEIATRATTKTEVSYVELTLINAFETFVDETIWGDLSSSAQNALDLRTSKNDGRCFTELIKMTTGRDNAAFFGLDGHSYWSDERD